MFQIKVDSDSIALSMERLIFLARAYIRARTYCVCNF